MARPIKDGLDYFPLDVDIFDDPKLLFIEDRFGVKGEIVTIKLLCWIYRNGGYRCEWNEEHAMIFAKKNFSSIKATLCLEIVNELLKRDFFNEGVFKSFGILTSKAIQNRWLNVISNSKRKSKLIPELNLLLTEETTAIKELTTAITDGSTQSKVKESKVFNNYTDQQFLKDWNATRTEKLKKPSNVKRIDYTQKQLLKAIVIDYSQKDVVNALKALFAQNNIAFSSMTSTPKHFLENFDRYHQAYVDKDDKLYGSKDKTA